jgi:hypothetical protein
MNDAAAVFAGQKDLVGPHVVIDLGAQKDIAGRAEAFADFRHRKAASRLADALVEIPRGFAQAILDLVAEGLQPNALLVVGLPL